MRPPPRRIPFHRYDNGFGSVWASDIGVVFEAYNFRVFAQHVFNGND